MSEQQPSVSTNQDTTSSHSEPRPEGVQINIAGHQMRIDRPHATAATPEPAEPAPKAAQNTPQPTTEDSTVHPVPPESAVIQSAQAEDSLLMDAGRIFEQMRSRLMELETREKTLRKKETELATETQKVSQWQKQLESDLYNRKREIEERERQLQQDLVEAEHERDKLEQRTQQIHEDESTARERLDRLQKDLESAEAELETQRQKHSAEMAERETALQEELASRQQEFDQQCEEQLAELKKQQLMTTKRITFQEQHLEKSRHEFESERTHQQQEYQSGRSQIEELTQQQLMRRQQLKRLRELIDLRAHSLHREEELIRESLLRQKSLLHQEATQFAAASQERTRREQAKRDELQRRYDELVMRERQVISRTERLEALRYELDLTHKENLELRISLEEIWADVCDQLGGEEANRRVEAHRAMLAAQYESREAAIVEDFLRLQQYRTEIQQMQQKLAEERLENAGDSTQWHEDLELQESKLNEKQTQLMVLYSEVEDQQTQWERKQIDAEKMIQQLVEELELMNSAA